MQSQRATIDGRSAGRKSTRLGLKPTRALAAAASVLAHVTLFFFAFSSASGDMVSAAGASGGATGPVFKVTLVKLAKPLAERQDSAADLRPLFAKLRSAPGDQPVPLLAGKGSGLNALADRLRNQEPPKPKSDLDRMPASSREQGSPSPSADKASPNLSKGELADSNGETAGSASTGDLWGVIEPCWRNLGSRGRVPVVIEVSLNDRGGLRGPPKVIRTTTALIDEPRLQAEASALAALAACAPRGNLQYGGRTYRLEFPAAR